MERTPLAWNNNVRLDVPVYDMDGGARAETKSVETIPNVDRFAAFVEWHVVANRLYVIECALTHTVSTKMCRLPWKKEEKNTDRIPTKETYLQRYYMTWRKKFLSTQDCEAHWKAKAFSGFVFRLPFASTQSRACIHAKQTASLHFNITISKYTSQCRMTLPLVVHRYIAYHTYNHAQRTTAACGRNWWNTADFFGTAFTLSSVSWLLFVGDDGNSLTILLL